MKKMKKILLGMMAFLITSMSSFATGAGGMVWEKPATGIAKSISGPVAGVIALVAVVVAALTWAMSEGGNMMGRVIKIVIGLAVAGGAAIVVSTLFGLSTAGGMMI